MVLCNDCGTCTLVFASVKVISILQCMETLWYLQNNKLWTNKFHWFWPTVWNSLPLTVRDPSLTLTQFCVLLKTVIFFRAFEMLPRHLSDSLDCMDCCTNTSSLNYWTKTAVATARLICLTSRSCWISPTTGCSARLWTIQLTHCIHSSLHSPQHRSTTIWDDARTTDSCQHKSVICVQNTSLHERCIKTVTEFTRTHCVCC